MIQKPRINLKDLFAALFISLGVILFLVNLHLMAIQEAGNVAAVLTQTFIIFLRIAEVMALFAVVFLIIHLLKWLVWSLTTPQWKKKQINRGGINDK